MTSSPATALNSVVEMPDAVIMAEAEVTVEEAQVFLVSYRRLSLALSAKDS